MTHVWGITSRTNRTTGRKEWAWVCGCGATSARFKTKHAAEVRAGQHVRRRAVLEQGD